MTEKKLDNAFPERTDTICITISLGVTRHEFDRWHRLKKELRAAKPKAKLTTGARKAISKYLDEVEEMLREYKKAS